MLWLEILIFYDKSKGRKFLNGTSYLVVYCENQYNWKLNNSDKNNNNSLYLTDTVYQNSNVAM